MQDKSKNEIYNINFQVYSYTIKTHKKIQYDSARVNIAVEPTKTSYKKKCCSDNTYLRFKESQWQCTANRNIRST